MILVDLFATRAESENVLRCFFIFSESTYLCLLKLFTNDGKHFLVAIHLSFR